MILLMDKKGFLLAEETLKILIAVIALVFLVYFLVSLYFAKVNGDKFEQAEALLEGSSESFEVIMNNISEGEIKTKEVIEPRGWYVFSFAGSEIAKPNVCANNNCVCICDDVVWEGLNEDRQQKECSEDGVCLIEESLGEFEEIKITGDLKILRFLKTGGRIYISENS